MSKLSDEREAELRASGWTDAEIRDYKTGWESAVTKGRSWVPAVTRPAEPPRVIQLVNHHPVHSELRQWQDGTRAGQLTKLLPAVDESAELEQARELRAHREFCYETEPPPLRAFRVAVRHSGPRGVTVSGSTGEVAQLFRNAGSR